MSDFARMVGLARPAVDAVLGEDATIKPQDRARGPHGARTPSATRPEVTITVIFYEDTRLAARNRAQPEIRDTGRQTIHRSPAIIGSTGYSGDIAIGDKLVRIATGETFEIITRDPDRVGNIILGLAAVANG